VSLAGCVFDQARIAGSEAPHGSIAETDFQFTGNQDDVLPARRGMPINKRAGRLLRKYYMLCGLRFSQYRMISKILFFQMRLAVAPGIHSENCHGGFLP
jgi:hypothetical protein